MNWDKTKNRIFFPITLSQQFENSPMNFGTTLATVLTHFQNSKFHVADSNRSTTCDCGRAFGSNAVAGSIPVFPSLAIVFVIDGPVWAGAKRLTRQSCQWWEDCIIKFCTTQACCLRNAGHKNIHISECWEVPKEELWEGSSRRWGWGWPQDERMGKFFKMFFYRLCL